MPAIEIVQCDILDVDSEIIAHQTNCVTQTKKGLAKIIFNKYPRADCYIYRIKPSTPGTIDIRDIRETDGKIVINMFAQYYPGKPMINDNPNSDGVSSRLEYFNQCLQQISEYIKNNNIKSIAFPWNIGCGLAGGKWEDYYHAIEKFSTLLDENVVVKLCKIS